VVAHDRNPSSRTVCFHILVAEVEVGSDIVMVVEAVPVRRLDYLAADCIDWAGAVDFLYQRNS